MKSESVALRDQRREGSINGAVEDLRSEGFLADFSVLAPGRIRCITCKAESYAREVRLLEARRVDVTTDPDEQSIVAGLECPACGVRGTYAFSYGPTASAEDAVTFSELKNARTL